MTKGKKNYKKNRWCCVAKQLKRKMKETTELYLGLVKSQAVNTHSFDLI